MKWFDRRFTLGLPLWLFPNLVERLRGTPARAEELVRGLQPEVLTRRPGADWSIQEHLGHLWDLEELWLGRVDDFLDGRDRLRPADLDNRKTHEARHNDADADALLASFRTARTELVRRLETLDESTLARSSLHPRLEQPMRVPDLAYFVAEHDDHHLARITQLKRAFTP